MTISVIYSKNQLVLKDKKIEWATNFKWKTRSALTISTPTWRNSLLQKKPWRFHLQGTLSLSWVQQGNCSSFEGAIAVVWNNESSCVGCNYVSLYFLCKGRQRCRIGHPKFNGLQTNVAIDLLYHTLDFKNQRAKAIRHVQPPYHLPEVFIEVIVIPPRRVRGCSVIIWVCLL